MKLNILNVFELNIQMFSSEHGDSEIIPNKKVLNSLHLVLMDVYDTVCLCLGVVRLTQNGCMLQKSLTLS